MRTFFVDRKMNIAWIVGVIGLLGFLGFLAMSPNDQAPVGDSAQMGQQGYQIGAEYRFKFNYKSTGESRIGVINKFEPSLAEVTGVFSLVPTSKTAHGTRALVEVTAEQVDILVPTMGRSSALTDQLQASLALPRLITIGVDGKMLPDSALVEGDLGHNIIQDILAKISIKSAPLHQLAWTSLESDLLGAARYQYHRKGHGEIEKIKGDYTLLHVAQKNQRVETQGNGRFFLTAAQTLKQAYVTDQTNIQVHGQEMSRSATALFVEFLGQSNLNQKQMTTNSATSQRLAQKPKKKQPSYEQVIQKSVLGKKTINDVVALVKNLDSKGKPETPELTKAVNLLYALLTLHPEKTSDLIPHLDDASAHSYTFHLMVGAMRQVGHQQAQDTLLAIADRFEAETPKLGVIIQNMGVTKNANEDLEQYVRSTIQTHEDADIKNMSYLALGNIAHGIRQGNQDTPREKAIVKELTAAIPEGDHSVIVALGNTRNPEITSVLSKYMKTSDHHHKAVAVRSLRHIKTEAAQKVLKNAASTEQNFKVRQAAIKAMGGPQATVDALTFQADVLEKEQSETVRADILRNLWDGRETFQGGVSFIKKAAFDDASQEVRKVARILLQGAGIILPIEG